ncbi:MAG: LytTR family transcriptional regulator DNA-binding domain-containing protein [Ruminococcus sp.]|nr:LytTR family transcriptional regulator DNA-binding domain-containing protein [Ruminococcus sp.]
MKIIIEDIADDAEEEIIIRTHGLDDDVLQLIARMKQEKNMLTCIDEQENILPLKQNDVYYFDAVDGRVYVYLEKSVLEIKKRLYEIEELCDSYLRISKAQIVNAKMIERLSPMFNGRLEAHLKNGEKVIISRQYVPDLKKYFGV